MASLAESYFEKYTGKDAAKRISDLPIAEDREFENDWIEFKGGKFVNDWLHSAPKDRNTTKTQIEKTWSEVVGAFANNSGGVLIWGVDANPKLTANGHRVDAPSTVTPIDDVDAFVTLLRELDRFVTDPPVSGIRHEAVKQNGNVGFVISYVPEGVQKPHRSEKAGRRFFIRSGDSKHEPSVSALRAMFYPQKTPRLTIAVEKLSPKWLDVVIADAPGKAVYAITVALLNVGVTSIRDGMYSLEIPKGQAFLLSKTAYSHNGVPALTNLKTWRPFEGVVHPHAGPAFSVLIIAPPETHEAVFSVISADNPLMKSILPLAEEFTAMYLTPKFLE